MTRNAGPEGQTQDHHTDALAGRTVFIGGAGSALGAALGEALARASADIVVGDIDHARAAGVAARLRELGARAYPIGFDAADPISAEQAIGDALENFGRLDVLINNAGAGQPLPIDELTPSLWLRVIDANLNGPFLLARHAAAHMRRAGGGHIVNVASAVAKGASAWHASQWGLRGLSHALHAELRPYNIKVSAVIADTPQDPRHVAEAVRALLLMPESSVVAEITLLSMQDSSWP